MTAGRPLALVLVGIGSLAPVAGAAPGPHVAPVTGAPPRSTGAMPGSSTPVRREAHPVHIRALDARTGEAVAGARLRLEPSLHRDGGEDRHEGDPPVVWLEMPDGSWTGELDPDPLVQVVIRAAGYRTAVRIVSTPVPERIDVRLEPAVVRLPDLEARVRAPGPAGTVHVWTPADRTAGPDLEGWLRSLPGVSVRGRGAGGERFVSIRGSRPQAVRVLLDGIPIADPLSGTTDLSLISASTLDRATLAAGAGVGGAGWGGLAGTLSLESRRPVPGVRARLGAGSFGRWETAADLGWEGGDVRLGLVARGETVRNDFSFANRVTPGSPQERRTNADRDAWSLLGRAEIGSRITALARADGVERGAPGRMGNHVWDEARWLERRRSLGLRWAAGERTDVVLAWSDLATEFRDPRTNRRSSVGATGWVARGEAPLPGRVLASWEATASRVDGDAFPAGVSRRTASARFAREVPLSNDIAIEPAAAVDVAREGPVVSPGVSLRWRADETWSLWWRAGQARRLPTFADIGLDPGTGARPNPDLVPERVVLDTEAGVAWRPSGPVSARAAAFYRRTRSPILWLPSVVGIWSPANLGRLDAFGVEAAGEWAPARGWAADARVTWQRSRVRFEDGAWSPVPYEPALAGGVGLRAGDEARSFAVSLDIVGRRRTNLFAPHDLPPYAVLDFRGRQAFTLMGTRLQADIAVLNALGSRYERVELFPEPGRRIEVGIAVSLGSPPRLPDGGSPRSLADARASDVEGSSGAGAPTDHRP